MSGKFEVYKDSAGEFRFRLKASNGQNILGSEGYSDKSGCKNGIESVKKNANDDDRYERKQASSGKYLFNLKAANHQVIGTSQLYETEQSRENGISSVKNHAPTAEIIDIT